MEWISYGNLIIVLGNEGWVKFSTPSTNDDRNLAYASVYYILVTAKNLPSYGSLT